MTQIPKEVASSMISVPQIFSCSWKAPAACDGNSYFFPLEDQSQLHYPCFCFLWVWMSSAHIEEERRKPRRGVCRRNSTFLLTSDWSTGKVSLMLSLPSSKYEGLYWTCKPRISTGDKPTCKLYIWKIASNLKSPVFLHICSIYFYEPVFKSTISNRSRAFISKPEYF